MNRPLPLRVLALLALTLLLSGVAPPNAAFAQDPNADTTNPQDPNIAQSAAPAASPGGEVDEPGFIQSVDQAFGDFVVTPLFAVLMYDFNSEAWLGTSVPLIVIWLLTGATFFTLRMGFINIRAFWHAVRLTKGDYDKPGEAGEVSHFQALASALSATVGLGNIAGVAIAVSTGGPGAIFWMILAGLIGMSSKFTECTLGQMYRKVAADGTISGGPMHYLHDGLAELGAPRLGKVLAVVFTILCIGASFGGGCAFQVSQSMGAIQEQVQPLRDYPYLYGIGMAILVGIVIIGGIRRIASTAGRIVPLMCGVYVAAALYILITNASQIGPAFGQIFSGAFTGEGVAGGFLGVMVIGIQRAVFSNEAGIGSASIAHSAAKTDEPVSEGIVALLEPFIDTVVVCTMTGLVIVITGAWNNPDYSSIIEANEGATLTSRAFGAEVTWFPYVLAIAVVLFAYSTMISWSYYGERCWRHLFGPRSSMIYRVIFLGFVILGSIVTQSNILSFSDVMLFAMAFPNIFGAALLSGRVKRRLDDYMNRVHSGEIKPVR